MNQKKKKSIWKMYSRTNDSNGNIINMVYCHRKPSSFYKLLLLLLYMLLEHTFLCDLCIVGLVTSSSIVCLCASAMRGKQDIY